MELLNPFGHKDYHADRTVFGAQVIRELGSEKLKLLYDIDHIQLLEGNLIETIQEHKDVIGQYHYCECANDTAQLSRLFLFWRCIGTERHAELTEHFAGLVVAVPLDGERDIQSLTPRILVWIQFGKDQKFGNSQVVIAVSVETFGTDPLKVANTWQHKRNQPIQAFVHSGTAKRDHTTDVHSLAQFEVRNGFSCLRNHWLLPGDLCQHIDSFFHILLFAEIATDPHIKDDFLQFRERHDIFPIEFFLQTGNDGFLEFFL